MISVYAFSVGPALTMLKMALDKVTIFPLSANCTARFVQNVKRSRPIPTKPDDSSSGKDYFSGSFQ